MLRAVFLALALISAPLWASLASPAAGSDPAAVHADAGGASCADHQPATNGPDGHPSPSCAIACTILAASPAMADAAAVRPRFASLSWPHPTGVAPDRLDWPPLLRPPSL